MEGKYDQFMNTTIMAQSMRFTDDQERSTTTSFPLKERKILYTKLSDDEELSKFYDVQQNLGKGSYGVVKAAYEIPSKKPWAIKILPKKGGSTIRLKSKEREIQILKCVHHPNIINLQCILESPSNIYLVFERCNGVLAHLQKNKPCFTEDETRRIIKDLADAVAYLHRNGIVHRDIKMENILLADNPNNSNDHLFIKLTDFGLSIVKTGSGYQDMMHEYCGTLSYMSPEIVTKKAYSQQCDAWAIGVLTYSLIKGKFPFTGNREVDIENAILNDAPKLDDFCLGSANRASLIHLIERMLSKDPAYRITPAEIMEHPWICEKPLNTMKDGNVLDMMAKWRDELKQPAGTSVIPNEPSKTPTITTSSRNSSPYPRNSSLSPGNPSSPYPGNPSPTPKTPLKSIPPDTSRRSSSIPPQSGGGGLTLSSGASPPPPVRQSITVSVRSIEFSGNRSAAIAAASSAMRRARESMSSSSPSTVQSRGEVRAFVLPPRITPLLTSLPPPATAAAAVTTTPQVRTVRVRAPSASAQVRPGTEGSGGRRVDTQQQRATSREQGKSVERRGTTATGANRGGSPVGGAATTAVAAATTTAASAATVLPTVTGTSATIVRRK